jgi:hypothetical protein
MIERTRARSKELGRSVRSVLTHAGLALDFFHKVPANGPRIDTLEKLATALDWTLGELMGFEGLDEDIVIATFQVMDIGLVRIPDRQAIQAQVFCCVYRVLAAKRREGETIDDRTLFDLARYVGASWGQIDRRPRHRQSLRPPQPGGEESA